MRRFFRHPLHRTAAAVLTCAALLGYFLFFQKPDVWTFVGAAVIFSSALYISHREAVRRSQIKTAGTQANPEA